MKRCVVRRTGLMLSRQKGVTISQAQEKTPFYFVTIAPKSEAQVPQ